MATFLILPDMNVNDILVIEFERYAYDATLNVKANTANVAFTVEAYFDVDALVDPPSLAAGSSNHTLAQVGFTTDVVLPVAAPTNNRITRVRITAGRIGLTMSCETPFRYYLEQSDNPPRIA